MSKRILITGGTGFIGSRLVDDWLQQDHQIVVLSRRPQWVEQRWQGRVRACDSLAQLNEPFDWLINLAGEGIADGRWSQARKQVLRRSRIDLTRQLLEWAQRSEQHFQLVMSGSAVGFYGSYVNDEQQGKAFTEQQAEGQGFAAQLCRDWENIAAEFSRLSDRLVLLRTAVVFGPQGGMLKRLWLPFRLGLGGVIGQGEQVLSWIHLEDYCRAVHHLCHTQVQGAVNMTAPKAVTNREFTQALCRELKRPALAPLPTWLATLLFGEMSELLLSGQRVQPQVLLGQGFQYHYTEAHQALKDIHQRW